MKVGKTRELLVQEIEEYLPILIQEHHAMNEITEHLTQYNISLGDIMAFINNNDLLMKAPIEEVLLFAEQIMIKFTELGYEWINDWLTKQDIKKLRTYKKVNPLDKTLTFPLVLDDVLPMGDDKYIAIVPRRLIGELYNNGLIQYNPELQREAKRVKQKDTIILTMNLNMKNVDGITKQALENDLIETTLYYNCQPFTGDDDEELSYDKRSRKLTIHKGTVVDILDGAHRTVGIYNAYTKKPDLEGVMPICFSNLTIEQAQRHQVDIAKATPISKGRIQELKSSRKADEVVKQLKVTSELKNRITSSEKIKYSLGEMVSYLTLSNAIDKYFKLNTRFDALTVAEDINQYITYLFGYYYSEEMTQDNLLFTNKMFVGHMYLAAKMKENGVSYSKLKDYLDKVDFSRRSDIWKEHEVIVNNVISRKAETGIIEVFEKCIWGRELCQS